MQWGILIVWKFVLGNLKTKEMCEDTVEEEPNLLEFVSSHCKTQETCENVIEEEPWALQMSLIGL